MTSISVNTGPLSAAASRVQALGRAVGQRAHGVELVLRGLDLKISARQHFDQRLRSVSARLSTQAQSLAGQARFLAMAAARYEAAENATRERVPEVRPRASGEAHIGARGAGEAHIGAPSAHDSPLRIAVAVGFPLVAIAKYYDDATEWIKDTTGVPVGEAIGFGTSVLKNYGKGPLTLGKALKEFKTITKVPLLSRVGDVLTVAEVLNEIQQGDFKSAAWDVAGLVPIVGDCKVAWEFGWNVGLLAARGGVSSWVIGHVEGADGWAPNYDVLSTSDAVSAISDGLTTRASGAWKWLGDHT